MATSRINLTNSFFFSLNRVRYVLGERKLFESHYLPTAGVVDVN